jgi:hypothetical protein
MFTLIKITFRMIKKISSWIIGTLERLGWKNRKKILFTVSFLITFFTAYSALKAFLLEIVNLDKAMLVYAYTFIFSLICFLLFEFYIFKKNLFINIISPGTRLFAVLPYIWLYIELTLSYSLYFNNFFKKIFNSTQLSILYKYLKPLLKSYSSLPGQKNGIFSYILFYSFFMGIARNATVFKFFIRYHYTHALLIAILLGVVTHYFSFISNLKIISSKNIGELGTVIYILFFNLITYSFFSAILGVEPNIPVMHSSIEHHIGKKKNEGIHPLDIKD